MPENASHFRRLIAALLFALLLAATLAPGAGADPFGELGHTGSKGTLAGQFTLSFEETDGIGVDPTDNSVYVLDQPGSEFRIQKFATNAKGEFTFVGAAKFKPLGGSKEEPDSIEGVAVDPTMGRIYVLALQERENAEKPDNFAEAASQLFAFSTKPNASGELLPAPGTPQSGKELGQVAGPKIFNPKGDKIGESLLEPTGIAVEPINATEDKVAILGEIDAGQPPEQNEIKHSAVWTVSSAGAITSQFTDTGDVLEDEANSPVFFNKKLFVESEEGIYEVPATGSPKALTNVPGNEEEEDFYEALKLWLTPSIQYPRWGDGLSVSPEGLFWSTASIRLASDENIRYPGAIAFNAQGRPVGWTGAQSLAKGATQCVLNYQRSLPLLAAGKEWTPGAGPVLFMLDDNHNEPKLIEFGPNGKGCPGATATPPAASLLGLPVEGPIAIKNTIEFSSQLTQADALEVEWNWNDGSAPTIVKTLGTETTFAEHKFLTGGEHEVIETIHTDDLATPAVVAKTKVTITGGAPTVVTGAPEAKEPTKEILKGTVNPNGTAVSECQFEYGETTAYGKTAACKSLPPTGTSPVAVEAEVTGLKEGTGYHFKLVAKSGAGSGEGTDATFTTSKTSQPPAVTIEKATGVTNETATLHAKVNPNGSAITECKFEYGESTGYGKSVACTPKPAEAEAAVTGALTGLEKSKTYHFRVVAKNAGNGTATDSPDETLKTTAIEPPAVVVGSASAVTTSEATLSGTVNPNGSKVTECRIEYGTATAHGSSLPCSPAPGEGASPVSVSATVSGLVAGSVYHFRIVAKNEGNKTATESSEASFTTGAAVVDPSPPTTTPPPPPTTTTGGVLPAKFASASTKLAGSSVSVPGSGAVSLKISCPASSGGCSGSVVLKTAGAVVARASLALLLRGAVADAAALTGHASKSRAAILTLASGAFSIGQGQSKTITLRLSAKAKKLLAKKHSISAKATITARNGQGESHTTLASLVLKAKKK